MVDRNRCDALSITGRREVTRSANPCRRCRPGRGGADHHQFQRRSRPADGIPASGSELKVTWPGTSGPRSRRLRHRYCKARPAAATAAATGTETATEAATFWGHGPELGAVTVTQPDAATVTQPDTATEPTTAAANSNGRHRGEAVPAVVPEHGSRAASRRAPAPHPRATASAASGLRRERSLRSYL